MTDDNKIAPGHAEGYEFVMLGENLSRLLLAAAEEQVARAMQALDQTKSLTEIIRNQVAAQAKEIEELNARFRAFGETMLDAHRKLNGNTPPHIKTPMSDLMMAEHNEKQRQHVDKGKREEVNLQDALRPADRLDSLVGLRPARNAAGKHPDGAGEHPDDRRHPPGYDGRDKKDRSRYPHLLGALAAGQPDAADGAALRSTAPCPADGQGCGCGAGSGG